jgi:homoserine kinase type II
MAVYTEVSDDDLAAFAAGYDLGRILSCKGIAEGVENTNYLVHTDKGPVFLTLYERRVDPRDLPFFLGLKEHLAAHGISCPLPVRDRAGRLFGELAGRPAAFVTFLEGVWHRRPSAVHCGAVGTILAQLHLAGRNFTLTRKNALGIDGWQPLFQRFAEQANAIAPGLRLVIDGEIGALADRWPRDLPAGVIHADLFPDNVFFIGDTLSGVIDFYFACNDAFAYDLAICLNAWCFEVDGSFNLTKGQALLRGYQRVRPLSSAEQAALPLLARGSALRFLLTRAYDWINTPMDALVARKDPLEYLRKLRFHQSVETAAAYGLGTR